MGAISAFSKTAGNLKPKEFNPVECPVAIICPFFRGAAHLSFKDLCAADNTLFPLFLPPRKALLAQGLSMLNFASAGCVEMQ
jgi:hypothetical protein